MTTKRYRKYRILADDGTEWLVQILEFDLDTMTYSILDVYTEVASGLDV